MEPNEQGELVLTPASWDFAKDLFEKKIALIVDEVQATEPPLLFFTNTPRISKILNKERKRNDEVEKVYVDNFRNEVAEEKEYKGGRKATKPFHFYNLLNYALANFNVHVNEQGLEADDALVIYQIATMKEHGVKIPVGSTYFYMDYEDWIKYPYKNFFLSGGYVVSDQGQGKPDKGLPLHRQVMGNPSGFVVDHINGDVLDNRKYNLRVCTPQQNRWNSKGDSTSKSKYKGVSWHSGKNKWESAIRLEDRLVYLGNSSDEEEAAYLYDVAAKEAFGEYAWLNLTPKYFKPFKETVICSRDKDVRMCPGWHYSWECGKQASVGPILVDELGHLTQINPKKVFGVGAKFFYYQLLVGDTVDNIGGIKGCGPAFAFKLLNNAVSIRQCYELVSEVYIRHHGDDWKTKFREQSDLLWMVREINEQGERVRWTPPKLES